MKVQELIDILEGIPKGATVYLAEDSEGTGFSMMTEFDICYVRKSDVMHGRATALLYDEDLDELTPEEIREDLDEVTVLWAV